MKHGKMYERNYGDAGNGQSKEESFRMKIWMENKAKIEKHNRHFYKVTDFNVVKLCLCLCSFAVRELTATPWL